MIHTNPRRRRCETLADIVDSRVGYAMDEVDGLVRAPLHVRPEKLDDVVLEATLRLPAAHARHE